MKLSIVSSTLDFIVALELKPEVKAPAAVQRRWHHRRFLEFGKKAWGRESWFFPFFFFTLWMLIPDKTVISKIGFVDFSKVFNFSSPEPNGQRRPAAFLCGPRRHSAFAGSPKSVDKCNHHSRLHERCAQSADMHQRKHRCRAFGRIVLFHQARAFRQVVGRTSLSQHCSVCFQQRS